MKIACHRWRLDYQREMEKRYDATFMAIESRYMTEIKALFVELAERREKEAVTKLLMEEKARGDAEAKEADKARREKERQKEQVEALHLEEGQRSLEDVRATLFKLWAAVEASADEKSGFLQRVFTTANFTDAVLKLCNSERLKLGTKLPLMQSITRREFVKYRLKVIHRFSQDPAKRQEFAEGTEGARARDLLMAELRVLNNRLRKGLQAYEDKFQEKFMFRGIWYLESMQTDSGKMPEIPAAWNAMDTGGDFGALVGASRGPEDVDAIRDILRRDAAAAAVAVGNGVGGVGDDQGAGEKKVD